MRVILMVMLVNIGLISCNAQSERTNFINKIKDLCPTADIIEMETKDNHVEIEYLCDEKIVEVGISFDMKVIYTETETTVEGKTLHIIQKKLDKKYAGWTLDEFAYVEMPDTAFYKAEMMSNGVEENVYFTLTGKYYKAKNVVLNESWTIASLEKSGFYNQAPYSFTRPDMTYDMPEILQEISGIAVFNETEIFCIQDEAGIVFRYNLQKEELSGMYRFTDVGDFEDIAIHDKFVSVLRSDGTIFSFDHSNYTGQASSRILPLNCMNVEGLFFDHRKNQFLIACKDQLINRESSKRFVFSQIMGFSSQLQTEFEIDQEEINTFIKKNYQGFSTRQVSLNPSSISIHPVTGETYVLSASNRIMAVYKNNQLKSVYPLAEELFFKPEGISFSKSGDMYISTEGNKKGYVSGKIHYFKWLK